MASWIDRIAAISAPPLKLEHHDRWKLGICAALLDRLGPNWIRESEAIKGLAYPNMAMFWALELGLAERRRRGWIRRDWWIRLSGRAWAAD